MGGGTGGKGTLFKDDAPSGQDWLSALFGGSQAAGLTVPEEAAPPPVPPLADAVLKNQTRAMGLGATPRTPGPGAAPRKPLGQLINRPRTMVPGGRPKGL